jgi:uncharacterized protein (DUF1015 family)
MAHLEPFRAWRPRRDLAARIAALPYDVMNVAEAREIARRNEFSFLRVEKSEIDLPDEVPADDPSVFARGAENLKRLADTGAMLREPAPAFYVYQQRMGDHLQAGLVAGASIDEYEANTIKKHEFTRRDKEDERTHHVQTLGANTGPVFLTYPARPEINRRIDTIRAGRPEYDFTSDDGVGHTLWVVAEASPVAALREAFARVPALYVADGHHRSAAATRVREIRRAANPNHRGDEPYNFFLAVIFPHDQMKIMAYNRLVRDLAGMTPAQFLARIVERFEVGPAPSAAPEVPRAYGMFLDGRWHRLLARPGSFPAADPVDSLDAAILQNNLLRPLLGIADPRTDKRIDFVGGIRGTAELERRCREGWAVAFALHPTSIEQLMSVADAGKVMPPKSTWFEPKLRSGLIVRPLDD